MSEMAELEVLDAPSTIVEYSATEAALADLRQRFAGVQFDLTTTKGRDAITKGRAEVRGYRTGLEKKRKEVKAPVLELARRIDAEAERITAELLLIEEPLTAQIDADDARRAAEKAERDRLEAERVAAAQAKIDEINAYPVRAATADAAGIQDLHDELAGIEPSLEAYGNRAGEAIQARDKALTTLAGLHAAALAREEAARVLAEQQEQLRQAQAAQAERERIAQAALAEQERIAREAREAEDARIAQQRQAEADAARARQEKIEEANAAAAAELKRQQDEFEARQRADQERRDAEARAVREAAEAAERERQAVIDAEAARVAAEADAERKRIQAEADEAARVEREAAEARQRKEEAERAARVAADTRMRNAAPAMHRALTLWIAAEQSGDADELQQAREARDEALTEAE